MRNFPATFLAELQRPGCSPYWVLKITTTGGTYYISDNDRFITPWAVQVYGATKSSGPLKEGISGALDEFKVAEYTIDLLLGIAVSAGGMLVETLADTGMLDDAAADRYLGLAGIADPPQLITPGRIRDFGTRTDTVLPVMIQDKTVDLERVFIGRLMSTAIYANAAAADVGKVIPIPFGSVRIPALCACSVAPYIYIFSDRAVTSVPNIWARNSGKADINITAYSTAYTGQPSQQLAGYEGKGVISISSSQAAQIQALVNLGLSDPTHDHPTPTSRAQLNNDYNTVYGGPTNTRVVCAPSFPSISGIIEVTTHISFSYGGNAVAKDVYVNGVLQQSGYTSGSVSWDGTTSSPPSIDVECGSMNVTVTMGHCNRTVLYTDATQYASTGVTLSQPAPATGVADQILIDCVADSNTFPAACSLLSSMAGGASVQVVGSLPVTSCAGLIDDYKTALYWLNYLSFQAGAWFMMPTGAPKLVSRSIGGAVRTITAIPAEGGRRLLTQTRTDLVDVIDKITVLYNRDWTKSKGPDAYNSATAVGGTGVRERPELFQFDFVTSSGDANTLRDLYVNYCKTRHRLIQFDNPIELADIESGDTVALAFLGGASGIVIPAEHAPGDMDKVDNIKLTVLI